jgi:hypothetical protein
MRTRCRAGRLTVSFPLCTLTRPKAWAWRSARRYGSCRLARCAGLETE